MLITVLLIISILEALLHYIPWLRLLKRSLHNIERYTLGCAAIFLPLAGGFWAIGNLAATLWVGLALLSAGLTVIACYAVDSFAEYRSRISVLEQEAAVAKNERPC